MSISQQEALMQLVSNFGDIAVLLPASLGLIVFLAWIGWRQDAAAYAAALTACLMATLFAKLVFATCGGNHPAFGVGSPSGHAAFGAMFYGCLALLFGTGRAPRWRLALYGGAAVLILAIGASRVALESHTVPEVVIGVLIGAISIALFAALRVKPERLELSSRTVVRMSPLAALYALCFLLLAGHWTAESFIDAIAAQFGADLHLCR
ncbi:MAG: phosphatase PAP2 family protein [Roseiarcus sp.]